MRPPRVPAQPAPVPEYFVLQLPEEAEVGLQIGIREAGEVTILDLLGRVTIGLSNDILSNQLRDLLDAGVRKVLINLSGVPQMDSSGISSLVRSFVTLQRLAGSLKLLRPTGHVKEVLELTRLSHAIPTYMDEAEALSSFGQAAGAK